MADSEVDVLLALLAKLPPIRQVRANVFARASPSSDAEVVARLYRYQGVNVYEREGSWCRVEFWEHGTGLRKSGWAPTTYLRKTLCSTV